MRKDTLRDIAGVLARYRRHRIWRKIVSVLACIVVFCTTYALILPAITMEKTPACGKTEHTHTEACYTQVTPAEKTVPVCTPESLQVHKHTEDCLDENGEYCCGYADFLIHEHNSACFDEDGNLRCLLPEIKAHTYSESCYTQPHLDTQESDAVQEIIPHEHTAEECFETDEDGNARLICGKIQILEHVHTDECFQTVDESADTASLTGELSCEMEEHTHTDQCHSPEQREYHYEDETVSVTAVLPRDSQVPADARLEVTPITREEERYSLLEQQAEEAVDGELRQLVLYDLNFYSPQEEYLPVEESASVTITFRQEVFSASGEDLTVLHYDRESGTPVALSEVEVRRDENQGLSGLTFQTEGFSVYGLADTVYFAVSEGIALYPGQVYTVDCDTVSPEVSDDRVVSAVSVTETETPALYQDAETADGDPEVAQAVPYTLILTAKAAGTATVNTGTRNLEVNVNDRITVEEGREVSIQLPPGAAVTSTDSDIAAAECDDSGLVTVTGVEQGNTNVTVTAEGEEYVWQIDVVLNNTFRLTYGDHAVVFHLVDNNGNPLEAEVADVAAESGKRYVFAKEDADRPTEENVENLIVPAIPGYQYVRAKYGNNTEYSVATRGYTIGGNTVNQDFRFYDTEPPQEGKYHSVSGEVNADLCYISLPITTTVSPSGTTINLFDYWVNSEDEGQVYGNNDSGINKGHALHFTTGGDAIAMNQWTGSNGGVRQGIVAKALGDDGYPYLSGNQQALGSDSQESLAYLFDPTYNGDSAAYRRTHHNVGGLLQIDDEGYYYYDSKKNYAEYDPDSNSFHIYPDWAVTHSSVKGQFFPFAPYSTVGHNTAVPGDKDAGNLNHFFGMTMTSRFIQQYGGYTGNNHLTPMTYEFSGDDDVWIFIDGVLVADLGGIHDTASVNINFAEGTVTISKVMNNSNSNITTSFTDIFQGTGVELQKGILQDDTYHTLKLFYMERGGVASNLHLKFNLISFPASGITKVDQVGAPVPGAEFALYHTGEDYIVEEGATPICSGITGNEGEFVFTDSGGQPLTLQELYEREKTSPYFVLRETKIPEGYRGTGADVHLEIIEGGADQTPAGSAANARSYVMVCTNTRDSGAFASPSLQVTAPNVLHLADEQGTEINLGQSQGTMFGIVLKYIGPNDDTKNLSSLSEWDNWSPVYGSAETGYTVVDRSKYQSIQDAIKVAKDQYIGNQNYFHQSSSGSYQALIEDLPGDIESYNFMAGNDHPEKVQYIVSYYWTDAATGTTTRVRDYTDTGGGYYFLRTFGTSIQVPNMINRIAVQKMDEDGVTPLNGAVFAMYEVEDSDSDGTDHAENAYAYVGEDSSGQKVHFYLETDTQAAYTGKAKSCRDADWTGSYEVDPATGAVTVTLGEQAGERQGVYTVTPVALQTSVAATDPQNHYLEDGIAEFDRMVKGKYIVRELTAPAGYTVNPNHAMVLVTDNAIYANAGTEDDGIAVSRGPGYLAGNLHYYASFGDINNTLTWVYSKMKASEPSNKFTEVSSESYQSWKTVTQKRDGSSDPDEQRDLVAYLLYRPSQGGDSSDSSTARFSYAAAKDTMDSNVSTNIALTRRLYTKIGWSYLEIYQNYGYGSQNHNPRAEYDDWRFVPGTVNEPDDLSNLFSRSIYIHMTDQKQPAELEITKTVRPGEHVAADEVPENTEFEFAVTLTQNDIPLTGSYAYQLYNVNGESGERTAVGDVQMLTLENGTGTVSLRDKQAVVIRGIPVDAVYTVVEKNPGKKYTVEAEKKVWKDGQAATELHKGGTVSGSMYWHIKNENGEEKLDNLSKVDFTNTYDPDADTITMTVRKVDSANRNKTISGAEFTLSREVEGTTEYYDGSGWVKTETRLTTNADGELQFTRLEAGIYILKEVKAPDGYYLLKDTITITVEDKRITATSGGAPCDVLDDGVTLNVPNSSGFELPETGGRGTTLFYILGCILAIGSAVALIIGRRIYANQ